MVRLFQETSYGLVLDSASRAVKSDTLVDDSLLQRLQKLLAPLSDQATKTHADSGHHIELVDPSLYPLVYSRTLAVTQGDTGSCTEALQLSGLGMPAPTHPDRSSKMSRGSPYRLLRWSSNFQWLPSEVAFDSEGPEVTITSYINNIHPRQHRDLYIIVERIISLSIQPCPTLEAPHASAYSNVRSDGL